MIRYLMSQKSGITYVISINYATKADLKKQLVLIH